MLIKLNLKIKGAKMKKNRVIKVVTLILALVCVLSLVGCSPKQKLKDVVVIWIEKANVLDYQGMFDNMTPDMVREIRGNKSVEAFLAEKTEFEIADAILKNMLPKTIADPVTFLKTLEYHYINADIRDNFSTLYANVKYKIDGETIEKEAIFEFARKNVSEPWKLNKISF